MMPAVHKTDSDDEIFLNNLKLSLEKLGNTVLPLHQQLFI